MLVNLRKEHSEVQVAEQDARVSGCSFALAAIQSIQGGESDQIVCYACQSIFSLDSNGKVKSSGRCMSTYTPLTEPSFSDKISE